MKIRSLGIKISILVALVIAVVIVLIVTIVSARTDALVNDFTTTSAHFSNRSLQHEFDRLIIEAEAMSKMVSRSEYVIDAIARNDMVALKRSVLGYKEGVDMISITDKEGTVLMRSYNDDFGDNIANDRSMEIAMSTGAPVGMIEIDSNGTLSTAGISPIYDYDGNIKAFVRCRHDLTKPEYVDNIKATTNSEVTIFAGDMRVNTTLINDKGERIIGTKASETIARRVLQNGETFEDRIQLLGSTFAVSYSPLISDGQIIGILFAGENLDKILEDQNKKITEVTIVGAATGIAGAVLIFIISIFMISKPLKRIGAFAGKIKSGELGISKASDKKIPIRSHDEIGTLARSLEQAYAQLQVYIGEIRERMDGLAAGDLLTKSTIDFEGDFVLIKNAINDIVQNLNQTMSSINSASSQVASGSKQIADGATSLAQGSTQQAASVQELSSSVTEIARKTSENATMANRAAELATSIKSNAEKGSRQMDDMVNAVKEISNASNEIGKVIKVIDDIAFQTNILALNAAVEAARAGQHGKGFAVVAEEVRNLAAKSAEAAKETGTMIQNSMDKAEIGARIAEETALSLSEIVNGINESDKIMIEIARSSEEQSQGVNQVNIGIDQVAQVVQQNSATAEQSAAASEQMSSQSVMLEKLISQFKVRETGTKSLGSSSSSRAPVPSPPAYEEETSGYTNGDFGKY